MNGFGRQCTNNPACRCSPVGNMNKFYTANCSNLGITQVPITRPDVVILLLQHNNITSLTTTFCPSLYHLDLSHNKIQNFSDDAFANLTRLKTLNLEGNNLELDESIYRPNVFKDLEALRELNIKNCTSKRIHAFPHEIWKNFTLLQILRIDVRSPTQFEGPFQLLTSLRELDVSGVTGFCSVGTMTKSFLINMPHLEILDVSACNLSSFAADALITQRNLSILNISYNERLTFASFENLSRSLQFSKIKVFKANKIHCTFGVGTVMQVSDIVHFQNTTLEELYLDDNRLALLEMNVLKFLPPSLKIISLVKNRLTIGLYLLELEFLSSIEKIDASFQYTSPSFIKMREAFDCQNPVRICKNGIDEYSVKYEITSGETAVPHFGPIILLPKNLTNITIKGYGLKTHITDIQFNADNCIAHLDWSQNPITSFKGPIEGLKKLEYWDLSECHCPSLTTYFFNYTDSLKVLKLNKNLLGKILENDTDGETFKNLVNLEQLDLSDNQIKNLPVKIFKNLRNIRELNLKSNSMTEWNVKVHHMRNLTEIDLSRNLLRQLSGKTVLSFSKLFKRKTSIKISLAYNLFACTCESKHFIQWSFINRQYISDFQNITCVLDNGTSIGLQSAVRFLEVYCTNFQLVTFLVSSVIIFFVVITVTGLIYRYRWKLRYIYYMTRNKYRLSSPLYKGTFIFDAFISYAEEDSDFAVNESISQLEDLRGLQLCLSKRDFRPGTEIAANITEAITKSRKTIIVLSNNFLNSYWCMFEFNMARMESIYTRNGKDVLFLIMYRHVSAKTLPLSMLALVESRSYIEYPDDPQGNIVFWDKIAETCSRPS
ncbi:toll-like receptor 4 [Saccostrea echinata]|uniref:toll-like receptor 4 n=1 Tax=Saccostrea echinata TaxID=191078 RepID=UPI002A82AB83|nr:toll-like receptor 4 [Saccostrea echinata]